MSGIRPPGGFKLAINRKKDNDVKTYRNGVTVNFFDVAVFLLSSLLTGGPRFNINIITGSGVMTIIVYKELTRNPEIKNLPIWILPNIWRLGLLRDIKFGKNVSDKKLLNAAKCQGLFPNCQITLSITLKLLRCVFLF